MLFLLLLVHFVGYSKSISVINPTSENLSQCLEKVECPNTEAPFCLSVKNKNQDPLYIIPLNQCEMEYLNCYPDVTATVEPMAACQTKHDTNITTKSPKKVDAVNNRVKRSIKKGLFKSVAPRTIPRIKSRKKTKNKKPGKYNKNLKGKKKRQNLGVIEFSSSKQKTEDLKNLKEWSPKSLERDEGRIYVGFVIELSRYMEQTLAEIKNCINSVLEMIQDDGSKRIKDLVLSVYVYPEKDGNMMTRTDDADEFMIAVRDLTCMCQNCNCLNNTCEQNIYQATIQALDRSAENSNMFVFGGGPPSETDFEYGSELIRLAREKQIEVNFVMTGDCGAYEDKPFQSLYNVAGRTNGMVLRVKEHHLKKEVIKYVNYTALDFDRRLAVSRVYPANGHKQRRVTFDISDADSFVSVAVSGNKVDCILRDYRFNNTLDYTYNVTAPHVKMYKYKGLPAGTYALQILPDVALKSYEVIKYPTLVSIAVSSIELMFKYGFDVKRKSTLKGVEKQPRKGIPQYIIVAVREPKRYLSIQSVSFHKWKNDEQISSYALYETDEEDVYATKYSIVVPKKKKFKVMLTAIMPYTTKEFKKFSDRLAVPYNLKEPKETSKNINTRLITNRGSGPDPPRKHKKMKHKRGQGKSAQCPDHCPVIDVHVCAQQRGVLRTFRSDCHRRQHECKHPKDRFNVVSKTPCAASVLSQTPTKTKN